MSDAITSMHRDSTPGSRAVLIGRAAWQIRLLNSWDPGH